MNLFLTFKINLLVFVQPLSQTASQGALGGTVDCDGYTL